MNVSVREYQWTLLERFLNLCRGVKGYDIAIDVFSPCGVIAAQDFRSEKLDSALRKFISFHCSLFIKQNIQKVGKARTYTTRISINQPKYFSEKGI